MCLYSSLAEIGSVARCNTGFVGSNIAAAHQFDGLYNSKNIAEAYGNNPDLLVYAGVPARKFFANEHPDEDFAFIENAIRNIQEINPKKVVLISSIDVIDRPQNTDEGYIIPKESLEPYGKNRLYLEEWVRTHYPNSHLIVRLPALYGKNLKKNFIYDILHPIPHLIKPEKFDELYGINNNISKYYHKNQENYYEITSLTPEENTNLKELLKTLNFSSLSFTDSRAKYQFYNLSNLWQHISIALENDIQLLHLATEPISASELYRHIYSEDFHNELGGTPANYNYKTKHTDILGGKNGYILDKPTILEDIKQFVLENSNEN